MSLDSLKRERFLKMTRGDNLKEVLDGLEEAERIGLTPVKINMVVIKGFNDDEITEFALMSKTKPYHIRFIEYMPFNATEGWQRDKCVTAKELKEMIERVEPLEPVVDTANGAGPARRYRFKDAPGEVGFISPISDHFCGSCNRLRLTSDGKIRMCLFSDTEIDVRKALRDGSPDEAIEDLLFKAVMSKPEKHNINNENIFKKCSRTMSLIGG